MITQECLQALKEGKTVYFKDRLGIWHKTTAYSQPRNENFFYHEWALKPKIKKIITKLEKRVMYVNVYKEFLGEPFYGVDECKQNIIDEKTYLYTKGITWEFEQKEEIEIEIEMQLDAMEVEE